MKRPHPSYNCPPQDIDYDSLQDRYDREQEAKADEQREDEIQETEEE